MRHSWWKYLWRAWWEYYTFLLVCLLMQLSRLIVPQQLRKAEQSSLISLVIHVVWKPVTLLWTSTVTAWGQLGELFWLFPWSFWNAENLVSTSVLIGKLHGLCNPRSKTMNRQLGVAHVAGLHGHMCAWCQTAASPTLIEWRGSEWQ